MPARRPATPPPKAPSTAATPRAIRIPDDEWDAALTAAHARGDTLSDVVRRALRAYVNGDDNTAHRAEGQRETYAALRPHVTRILTAATDLATALEATVKPAKNVARRRPNT